MKKTLLFFLPLFIGFLSSAQVPVLYYDFEMNTSRGTYENAVEQAVNNGNSALTTNGVTNFGGQANGDASSIYGGTGNGVGTGANGWSRSATDPGAGATQYFQFSANTEGLSGLALEFDCLKALSNAPNRLGVLWSRDGINFFPATTLDNATSTKWKTFTFPFGEGADNQSKVTIRIYGYDAGNSSPFLYLDNITLKARIISGVKKLLDFDAYGLSLTSGKAYRSRFSSLTISGAGSIVYLNSRFSYSGILTVGSGATLSIGTQGAMSDSSDLSTGDARTGGGELLVEDGSTLQLSSTDKASALKATLGTSLLKLNSSANIEYIGGVTQYQDAAILTNVIISNSNGVVQNGDVVINGNLTLKNGTMNPGTNKLTIKGNITKTSGTINASTSEVVFNGTTKQTVAAGIFAGNVKRLNIDNQSGVDFDTDATITEAVNLTTGKLNIGNKKLTIGGQLSRNGSTELGTIDAQVGSIEFNGTVAQAVPQGAFEKNKVKSLRISNTSADGVSLHGAMDITDALDFGTVNNGKLKTNGHLTLKSDATGTARVGDLTNGGVNSGNTIEGPVSVERFTPAHTSRRWRLMTSPVMNTTINEAWQEAQKWDGLTTVPSSGFGTLITGQQQGTATKANNNGFDYWSAVANGGASIRAYVPGTATKAATFQPLATTTAPNAFNNHESYLVFIRGDRAVSAGTTPGTTTVRAKGSLKHGSFTIDVPTANSHTLIGNPYAAPLDFKAIYDANSTKIQPSFWVWQAPLGTGTGGYVLVRPVSPGSELYETIPGNGSQTTANRLIHSGEGFFVVPNPAATGTNTITIQERHKAAGVPGHSRFRNVNQEPSKLYVNLSALGVNSEAVLLDGVLAQYDASEAGFNIAKSTNSTENISIQKNGSDMILATSDEPKAGETLQLRLWNTVNKSYELEIRSANFTGSSLTSVLVDRYLQKETILNLNEATTRYTFTVTSDAASKDPSRFYIAFKEGSTLPVAITNLKAEKKHNNNVEIYWKVADESSIKAYQVEKSVDGATFTVLTSVAARASAGEQSYVTLDAQPAPVGYYRIKMQGTDGETKYSAVVKVQLQNTSGESIMLYPNPVSGGNFNVQLVNKPQGVYTLTLYNMAGQRVISKIVEHRSSHTTETITLNESLTAGNYKLEVKNANSNGEVLNVSIVK